MLRARCGTVALAALVALAASMSAPGLLPSARADALPDDYEPPVCSPVACPEGSTLGGGGHGSCPSSCVPISFECAPDGACAPDARCVPTRFCLDMRGIGRVMANVVVGECAADGSCVEGTCHEVSRCVTTPPGTGGPSMPGPREGSSAGASSTERTAPLPPSPPAASSGMCTAARTRRNLPFTAVGLLVVAALGRARLRRRRR
jgi:hypothetical protein